LHSQAGSQAVTAVAPGARHWHPDIRCCTLQKRLHCLTCILRLKMGWKVTAKTAMSMLSLKQS
ncbi:hypothetical protein GGH99_003590, partial [Coemansia sp. RSA 1285]